MPSACRSLPDAFTSCGDFGVSPPWDYTVACLNCTAPLATFTVVMDCANLVFYIEVNITTLEATPRSTSSMMVARLR